MANGGMNVKKKVVIFISILISIILMSGGYGLWEKELVIKGRITVTEAERITEPITEPEPEPEAELEEILEVEPYETITTVPEDICEVVSENICKNDFEDDGADVCKDSCEDIYTTDTMEED